MSLRSPRVSPAARLLVESGPLGERSVGPALEDARMKRDLAPIAFDVRVEDGEPEKALRILDARQRDEERCLVVRAVGVIGGERPDEICAEPARERRIARSHQRFGSIGLASSVVKGAAAGAIAEAGVARAVAGDAHWVALGGTWQR